MLIVLPLANSSFGVFLRFLLKAVEQDNPLTFVKKTENGLVFLCVLVPSWFHQECISAKCLWK